MGAAAEIFEDPTGEPFEAWYRTYSSPLRAWCFRILRDEAAAQDVVHETLLRAWTRREKFRGGAQIAPWLWCVARNLCMDHLRRGKHVVVSDAVPESPDVGADPAAPIEAEERRVAVRGAMRALSLRHREALYLREVDGVSYRELARHLGITEEGARAVLFRARKSLRKALKSSGELFGALLPIGNISQAVNGIRAALAGAGSRVTMRPAAEIAAAAAAAIFTFGPHGGVQVEAPRAEPTNPTQMGAVAAPYVPHVPPAASRLPVVVEVSGTAQPSMPLPASPAAEDMRVRGEWRATVRVGGTQGDPASGLGLDVALGSTDSGSVLGGLPLPSLDIGLLERRPTNP